MSACKQFPVEQSERPTPARSGSARCSSARFQTTPILESTAAGRDAHPHKDRYLQGTHTDGARSQRPPTSEGQRPQRADEGADREAQGHSGQIDKEIQERLSIRPPFLHNAFLKARAKAELI
uniref:Uncharacterized protein n=1 Tax=Ditylenchus dipsaci TaxID=166011 RepID=A0A915EQB8_9BILA